MPEPDHKERDWIDLGLKATTPLIVGLVIAWVGIYGDEALNKLSHRQQSARLITELQIRREQDESALRKDIFTRALDAFLLVDGTPPGGKGQQSLDDMSKQLLRLELLALNFGDSLSLTPLFVEMRKDLSALRDLAPLPPDKNAAKDNISMDVNEAGEWNLLLKRLTSLAKRVSSSQLSALAQHGNDKKIIVPLGAYRDTIEEIKCEHRTTEDRNRFEPRLLYQDRHYSWPHDEAMRLVRPVVVNELLIPLVLDPLVSMHDLMQETSAKMQTAAFVQGIEILQDSTARIEKYLDDGLNRAETIGQLYWEVKEAIAPVLELEESTFDDDKAVEAWRSLKSRFAEQESEGGEASLWSDIASYFEEDSPNLEHRAREYYDAVLEDLKNLEFQGVTREVEIIVSEVDHCLESLQVEIIIQHEQCDEKECKLSEEATPSFGLDYFNFPVVDNTRLAHNHRLAAVVEEFDTSDLLQVEITLVVFPSEYASLRDRPGMEEVRSQLQSAMEFEPGGDN